MRSVSGRILRQAVDGFHGFVLAAQHVSADIFELHFDEEGAG
jgi:hypothetical protein